jgi:hypothetical protein
MTAIVPSDVLLYLSAPSASAGFVTAGTPGSSWGKFVSSTELSGTAYDNLFSDITGAENAASQVDYACLFVLNNTSSGNSMLNVVAWLPTSADVAGGATVAIGADPNAASVKTTSSVQAAVISTNTNAPAGVNTWVTDEVSDPTSPSYTGGLQLGTIPPGYVKAIWVQRTAANTAPLNADGFGIQIDFDTQG